ncbi:MAG: hypothetical protein EPN43_00200 [Jatrophihabitans sp.]|nr:MAG: hypothetical protein EPN43_00200 [Jatrophihabitans sp.]
MARALLGYVGSRSDQVLLVQIAQLRRRIDELESEVADLRATARMDLDLHSVLDGGALDGELGRIAEAPEPALA